MDAFHYDTYTYDEMVKKCVLSESVLFETKNVQAKTVVSYEQAKRFKVEKYTFSETVQIPDFDGHRIAITIKGSCDFSANGYTSSAEQGRGVFLPCGAKGLTLTPCEDGETIVLICYPPKPELNPKDYFKNPIQIGVLVDDLESYLKKLESVFGIGPFRIAEYPPEGTAPFREYRGKEGNFIAKFCFYHLGNIELELIQPISGDNIWREHIDKHGQGIHHLKFLVPDS